jgi:hypothetical protein
MVTAFAAQWRFTHVPRARSHVTQMQGCFQGHRQPPSPMLLQVTLCSI